MATPVDIIIRGRDEFSTVIDKARSQISGLTTSNIELTAAISNLSAQIALMGGSFGRAHEGVQRIHQSFLEGRESARGLGEELGVKLPGFVASFLSRSALIGPALAGAFNVIAVVGLIDVLSQIPEAITKIVDKLAGWDAASKKTFGEQIKSVDDLRKGLDDYAITVERAKNLGLPAGAKAVADMQTYKEEIVKTEGRIRGLEDSEKLFRGEAEKVNEQIKNMGDAIESLPLMLSLASQFDVANKKADEFNKTLQEQKDLLQKQLAGLPTKEAETAKEVSGAAEAEEKKREEAQRKLASLIATSRDQLFAYGNEIQAQASRNVGLITNEWMKAMDLEQKGREDYLRHLEGNDAAVDEIIRKNQDRLLKYQEDIDKQMSAGIRPDTDRFLKAIDMASKDAEEALKEIDRKAKEVVDGIVNDVGRMFTDSISHGKNFWEAFKQLGLDVIASLTNAMVKGLLTRSLGPLLGKSGIGNLIGNLSGLGAGAIGFAGTAAAAGVAAPLVSTIGTASVINAGAITGGAIAAPAAFGGAGIAGSFGLSGGAGLFGLGAATIPVLGAIALGIFGLSKLFGHTTHEAPFSQDPNTQQDRTYFFYAANELASATRDMADATRRLNGIKPEDVIIKGLPGALQQSNQFRRNVNGVLQDDI